MDHQNLKTTNSEKELEACSKLHPTQVQNQDCCQPVRENHKEIVYQCVQDVHIAFLQVSIVKEPTQFVNVSHSGPSDATMTSVAETMIGIRACLEDQIENRRAEKEEKKDKWQKLLDHQKNMILMTNI